MHQLTFQDIQQAYQMEKETSESIRNIYQIHQDDDCEKILIDLHKHTKLLFPSYLLRMVYFNKEHQASLEVLKVLLEGGSFNTFAHLKDTYNDNLSSMPSELYENFLVLGIQNGHHDFKQELVEHCYKYLQKLTNRILGPYYFKGMSPEDVFQEAWFGFNDSSNDFKIEKRTPFREFTRYVIERRLGSILKSKNSYKARTIDKSYSMNMPVQTNQESESTTFEDLLESDAETPGSSLEKIEFFERLKKHLSYIERLVLYYYDQDFVYKEIGFELMKHFSKIDIPVSNYEELEAWIETNRQKEDVLVDTLIQHCDTWFNQMVETYREEEGGLFSFTQFLSAHSPEDSLTTTIQSIVEAHLSLQEGMSPQLLNVSYDSVHPYAVELLNIKDQEYREAMELETEFLKKTKSVDNTIYRFKGKGKELIEKDQATFYFQDGLVEQEVLFKLLMERHKTVSSYFEMDSFWQRYESEDEVREYFEKDVNNIMKYLPSLTEKYQLRSA